MEKLRLFFAAAFVAALMSGCSGPNPPPDTDSGPLPGDSGLPDVDGGVDPMVDSGVDANVPPGEDGGMDAGTITNACEDVEYIGAECNLPQGMIYTRSEFICGSYINNDLWLNDEVGAVPSREFSREESGVLYAELNFAFGNDGMVMPDGSVVGFTCGPEGRCWINWFNPDSNYSHCRVSFQSASGGAGCDMATTECWLPGSTAPVTSYAIYISE